MDVLLPQYVQQATASSGREYERLRAATTRRAVRRRRAAAL